MPDNINLSEKHLKILQQILQEHPGCHVFGSRVTGTSKEFSDIDLCFVRDEPMKISELSKLKTEFEDSNLPFKVDIVDYKMISDEFRQVIDKNKIPFPYF